MTNPESIDALRKFRAAIDALDRAYEDAVAALNAITAQQQAFEQATELANRLRHLADVASDLRAGTAARIWEAENLSLAQLADRIGISKARADQLVRAATGRPPQKRGRPPAADDSDAEEERS